MESTARKLGRVETALHMWTQRGYITGFTKARMESGNYLLHISTPGHDVQTMTLDQAECFLLGMQLVRGRIRSQVPEAMDHLETNWR